MKTIIFILSIIATLSGVNAQTTTKSKSNVKINYSSDSDEPGNSYKVNISINNNDDVYTLKAVFPASKTQKLKKFLNDHLETKMSKSSIGYRWHYINRGEVGYKVTLKKGKLSVFLDKEYASVDLIEDFVDMFSDLRDVVKD